MLSNITIHNLAIIDEVSASFEAGFNVLSGETGAGKSIIINALGLVLGDRASADLVRTGASEARVEALFVVPPGSEVQEVLARLGLPDHVVVKTLVMRSEAGRRLLVLMHGDRQVSAKRLAREAGVRRIDACTPDEARQRLEQWKDLTEQPLLYAPSVNVPQERLRSNLDAMFEIFGSI